MSRRAFHKFRLYIAGSAGNSALAIQNLDSICRAYLPGQYEIEHVDVFKEPERARADSIVMTPTLLRLSSKPVCRVVGTLSDSRSVLTVLGLAAAAA
ncbi:MAG TPA: circadian clock KaiB family protein [Steroidobacteraceae bacterium]|nr:circadian clock KaiB family protein [Steroidobacteraceae bacterium]